MWRVPLFQAATSSSLSNQSENTIQMAENDSAQEGVSESNAATKPTHATVPRPTADKRAAVLLAKKKQRRAAHRVTLRRSHTKG
jgi:hypothetical protein